MNGTENKSGTLWSLRDTLPRMNTPAAVVALIATSLLAALTTVSGGASFIIMPIAAALQALMFLLWRKPYSFLSAALSYGAAWLFTASPVSAVPSLLYLPVAVVLAGCVYMSFNCAKTVAATAVPAGALTLAMLLYDAVRSGMGVSGYFDYLRELLIKTLTSVTVATESGPTQLLTDEVAVTLVTGVVNIAPALAVLVSLAVGFIAARTLHSLCTLFRSGIFTAGWVVTCDMPTVVIYVASYFIAFILSFVREAEGAYYAVENVVLIFAAAPMAVGVRVILDKMNRSGTPFMRAIWMLVVAMLFVMATNLTMSVSAMIGVVVTVRGRVKAVKRDGDER